MISKKEFIRKMENVDFERFTVDGELWTAAPIGKYAGTSPKGIWTIFTNGKQKKTIYKADVLLVDYEKAVALFHRKAVN